MISNQIPKYEKPTVTPLISLNFQESRDILRCIEHTLLTPPLQYPAKRLIFLYDKIAQEYGYPIWDNYFKKLSEIPIDNNTLSR